MVVGGVRSLVEDLSKKEGYDLDKQYTLLVEAMRVQEDRDIAYNFGLFHISAQHFIKGGKNAVRQLLILKILFGFESSQKHRIELASTHQFLRVCLLRLPDLAKALLDLDTKRSEKQSAVGDVYEDLAVYWLNFVAVLCRDQESIARVGETIVDSLVNPFQGLVQILGRYLRRANESGSPLSVASATATAVVHILSEVLQHEGFARSFCMWVHNLNALTAIISRSSATVDQLTHGFNSIGLLAMRGLLGSCLDVPGPDPVHPSVGLLEAAYSVLHALASGKGPWLAEIETQQASTKSMRSLCCRALCEGWRAVAKFEHRLQPNLISLLKNSDVSFALIATAAAKTRDFGCIEAACSAAAATQALHVNSQAAKDGVKVVVMCFQQYFASVKTMRNDLCLLVESVPLSEAQSSEILQQLMEEIRLCSPLDPLLPLFLRVSRKLLIECPSTNSMPVFRTVLQKLEQTDLQVSTLPSVAALSLFVTSLLADLKQDKILEGGGKIAESLPPGFDIVLIKVYERVLDFMSFTGGVFVASSVEQLKGAKRAARLLFHRMKQQPQWERSRRLGAKLERSEAAASSEEEGEFLSLLHTMGKKHKDFEFEGVQEYGTGEPENAQELRGKTTLASVPPPPARAGPTTITRIGGIAAPAAAPHHILSADLDHPAEARLVIAMSDMAEALLAIDNVAAGPPFTRADAFLHGAPSSSSSFSATSLGRDEEDDVKALATEVGLLPAAAPTTTMPEVSDPRSFRTKEDDFVLFASDQIGPLTAAVIRRHCPFMVTQHWMNVLLYSVRSCWRRGSTLPADALFVQGFMKRLLFPRKTHEGHGHTAGGRRGSVTSLVSMPMSMPGSVRFPNKGTHPPRSLPLPLLDAGKSLAVFENSCRKSPEFRKTLTESLSLRMFLKFSATLTQGCLAASAEAISSLAEGAADGGGAIQGLTALCSLIFRVHVMLSAWHCGGAGTSSSVVVAVASSSAAKESSPRQSIAPSDGESVAGGVEKEKEKKSAFMNAEKEGASAIISAQERDDCYGRVRQVDRETFAMALASWLSAPPAGGKMNMALLLVLSFVTNSIFMRRALEKSTLFPRLATCLNLVTATSDKGGIERKGKKMLAPEPVMLILSIARALLTKNDIVGFKALQRQQKGMGDFIDALLPPLCASRLTSGCLFTALDVLSQEACIKRVHDKAYTSRLTAVKGLFDEAFAPDPPEGSPFGEMRMTHLRAARRMLAAICNDEVTEKAERLAAEREAAERLASVPVRHQKLTINEGDHENNRASTPGSSSTLVRKSSMKKPKQGDKLERGPRSSIDDVLDAFSKEGRKASQQKEGGAAKGPEVFDSLFEGGKGKG